MKILHFSTSDGNGGAAKAAHRIHRGLVDAGIDSTMYVGRKETSDPRVLGPETPWEKFRAKLAFRFDRYPLRWQTPAHSAYRSLNWTGARTISHALSSKPDLVHLHWIGDGFLRIEDLTNLDRPVVWRLADMWPFGGAEHYLGDDRRYVSGYLPTNRPNGDRGLDLSSWVWRRKLRAYTSIRNLTIVTPSRWLADCARESLLFRNRRVEVIPTGQNLDKFRPQDRRAARQVLGLPLDQPIVAFGAFGAVADPRKGARFLREALAHLRSKPGVRPFHVLVFGNSESDDRGVFGDSATFLGRIDGEDNLSRVYSASDVFVAPSVEENLPNTVIEAMACGVPCVGFSIGGMPDIIRNGENGFLASAGSISELAQAIESTWKSPNRDDLGRSARLTVERQHTVQIQAKRYADLYDSILTNKRRS